jgi:hypothetical protein
MVYGASEGPVRGEVLDALRRQTRPPVALVAEQVGLPAAVSAAATLEAEWIWLLDGGAVPEPHALEALLEATAGEPAPVLLCSQVLGPDGHLDPGSLPRHVIYATENSVAAAERHLIQLRAAGSGSVLIRRRAIPRNGSPRHRPGWDMVELSARILRDGSQVGYLVPGSVATRRHPLEPAGLASRMRSLTGGAFTPREKLREGFDLARQLGGLANSTRRAGRGR